MTVPDGAVDGQSLVAGADLVVSAGGTMNREAVVLGTPVYTTFAGRLGGVDERLIAEGRLRPLERLEDLIWSESRSRRHHGCAETPIGLSTWPFRALPAGVLVSKTNLRPWPCCCPDVALAPHG